MDEALKNMPEVELLLNDNSVYNKKGIIESISGVIDRQTGTVVARVVFPNESRLLHSGASGTVVVPNIYKDCIAIPQTAPMSAQLNGHWKQRSMVPMRHVRLSILPSP